MGRKEEKQGRGLLWERKTRSKGCGAEKKGRMGEHGGPALLTVQ